MAETPERCPTCGTKVPEGAPRCPGCGRVFGEENRCPHCNAVAAVIRRGQRTVCAACGKPRAGAVVLGETEAGPSTSAMLTRARGRSLRALGVLALAGGIMAAAIATMAVPGAAGLALALVAGLLGVGLGTWSLRAGTRARREAEDRARAAREKQILRLAAKQRGRLTATKVAETLSLSVDEADAALTGMVGDGSRVDVDVDGEGVVTFVFRELAAHPQVRVATEDVVAEAELASDEERQRRSREP